MQLSLTWDSAGFWCTSRLWTEPCWGALEHCTDSPQNQWKTDRATDLSYNYVQKSSNNYWVKKKKKVDSVYVSSAKTLVVTGNTDPVTDVSQSLGEQPQHYLLSKGSLTNEQSGGFAARICHLKHTLTDRKVAVHLKAACWNLYLQIPVHISLLWLILSASVLRRTGHFQG